MTDDTGAKKPKNMVSAILTGLVITAACIGIWKFSDGGTARGDSIQPTGAVVTEETRIGLSTRLQVEYQGSWYEAKVIKINKDGTFKVHYDGWDSRFDENISRSRMRLAPVPDIPTKK